jgi:hypothetical protein
MCPICILKADGAEEVMTNQFKAHLDLHEYQMQRRGQWKENRWRERFE